MRSERPGSEHTTPRTLAEAHRSGQRLPDAVLDAYLHGVDRDEAELAELRQKVQDFKSWFRTH